MVMEEHLRIWREGAHNRKQEKTVETFLRERCIEVNKKCHGELK